MNKNVRLLILSSEKPHIYRVYAFLLYHHTLGRTIAIAYDIDTTL